MPVITIFGATFGDDEALAQRVAATLGYPCISREIFVEASQRYGIPEAKLSEIVEREPHWWNRWLENLRPYRIALQAAMCEVAESGSIVYHGHVGHGLLAGIRHVLKVLLTAPMQFRIDQVRARQGLDAARARRYIDQVDRARSRRLMALFGTDWRDPGQYAFVLNRAQISSTAAVELIVQAAGLEDYQPTAASRQDFANLALATRVQAALLTSSRLRDLDVGVEAKQGEVLISGLLPQSISEQEIRMFVEKIPGVSRVVTDLVRVSRAALYRP